MANVRRSPQAEADLEAIFDYLEKNASALTQRYADAFEEKARLLANFPEMGRPRPEIGPAFRSTLVDPYVIFYRVEGDEVQILRILHGKRDLRSIMRVGPEE